MNSVPAATTQPAAGEITVLTVNGIINPIVAEYLTQNISHASEVFSECIIIELDTPGGLLASTKDIVKAIQNSDVPVITFVSPRGASAASAGTYITLASHIAAMAPATNIGAATPVDQEGKSASDKVINHMASYIVTLAKDRGRNTQWAEKAVREGHSSGADEALKENVVDLIASGLPDLLAQIHGRQVRIGNRTVQLNTLGGQIKYQKMTWMQEFLDALAHPEVAYILLMLGIWGLYFELANPGVILPGVIGGLCLILGMLALQILPYNLAGVLLILLAVILFIAELKTVTNGILTAGGIIAFVLGSFLLFPAEPYGKVPWSLILVCSGMTGGFFAFAMWLVVKAQRSRIVMGVERLAGVCGIAQSELSPAGFVLVDGEQWSAESIAGPIRAGDKVEIVRVEGLKLRVKAAGGE